MSRQVLEVKAERLRMAKMMQDSMLDCPREGTSQGTEASFSPCCSGQERNQEYLNLLHSLRQPIFEASFGVRHLMHPPTQSTSSPAQAQLKRMEERKMAVGQAQPLTEFHRCLQCCRLQRQLPSRQPRAAPCPSLPLAAALRSSRQSDS